MKASFLTLLVCIIFTSTICEGSSNATFELSGKRFYAEDIQWSASCTSSEDALATIDSISLQPDPIRIPGQVSLGFAGKLNREIKSPIPFHLRIWKKVSFAWIKVPCEASEELGSCDYDDFCTKWPIPRDLKGECPEAYKKYGIPCSCPFEAKDYNLPQSVVGEINASSHVPKWLERGQYKIKAWLSEPNNYYALCLELNLNLKPA